jgi:hypothetical protein
MRVLQTERRDEPPFAGGRLMVYSFPALCFLEADNVSDNFDCQMREDLLEASCFPVD